MTHGKTVLPLRRQNTETTTVIWLCKLLVGTKKYEMMENKTNNKSGLLKLGYVANLKSCKSELNELLADEKQVSTAELNTIVP